MADPEQQADKLRAVVAAFRGQRFVVVDGGHFDDFPALLRRARLFARSLFLDHADKEVEKAGPWLLSLDQEPEATSKLLAIVENRPAAVFWSCSDGEAVLYRHLRTLNVARIPDWAADGADAPVDRASDDTFKQVFFRHFDPSVLGAIMPVLDAAQFARVLGPADEIAFFAADYGGVRRVLADPHRKPTSGLLTLTSLQIQAMSERRIDASHWRNVAYLRDVAGQYIADADDAAVHRHVRVSYETGRQLGLVSEGAHARWALLMVLTKGRILDYPDGLNFIARGPKPPDRQIEDLLTITAESMRAGRGRS